MQLSLPRTPVSRSPSELSEARFDWSILRLLAWLVMAFAVTLASLHFRPDATTPPPLTATAATAALSDAVDRVLLASARANATDAAVAADGTASTDQATPVEEAWRVLASVRGEILASADVAQAAHSPLVSAVSADHATREQQLALLRPALEAVGEALQARDPEALRRAQALLAAP